MTAPPRVFAYGTLMFPEVMGVVAGRPLAGRPARLPGHRRFALAGAAYPGLAPDPAARVEGRLWEGVAAPELARLDRFEGGDYRRVIARVEPDAGPAVDAFVYLSGAAHAARRLAHDWSPEAFAARELAAFLAHCRAIAPALGAGV